MSLQNIQSAGKASTFGSNGIVLRATPGSVLALDAIQARIPSVFAERPHESRSEKYSYIPTMRLLTEMEKEGFYPVEVRQGGSRIEDKRAFTKHLIRFRQANQSLAVGDNFPEIALLNSHDGTSQYELLPGWFRLACLNGLYVSLASGTGIKVPHRGDVSDVIEASYRVVEDFPKQAAQIEDMRAITLTQPEQIAFANAAASLRWDDPEAVDMSRVLRPHRPQDTDSSLWTTFNRVQENVIRGGVPVHSFNAQGRRQAKRSREVNGINDTVRLNQALWTLSAEMAKLKTA